MYICIEETRMRTWTWESDNDDDNVNICSATMCIVLPQGFVLLFCGHFSIIIISHVDDWLTEWMDHRDGEWEKVEWMDGGVFLGMLGIVCLSIVILAHKIVLDEYTYRMSSWRMMSYINSYAIKYPCYSISWSCIVEEEEAFCRHRCGGRRWERYLRLYHCCSCRRHLFPAPSNNCPSYRRSLCRIGRWVEVGCRWQNGGGGAHPLASVKSCKYIENK